MKLNLLSEMPLRDGAHSSGISAHDFLNFIVHSWKVVLIVSTLSIVLGFVFLTIAEKKYTATVVVGPSFQTQQDSQASGTSALRRLAQLGGGNLGEPVSPYVAFIDGLDSHSLAKRLQEKHALLQIIFADRWDTNSGTWRPRVGLRSSLTGKIKSVVGFPATPDPNIEDLANFIHSNLKITPSENSASRKLEFKYKDREIAQEILGYIVVEMDGIIRETVRGTSLDYVSYLETAIGSTSSKELRDALISLLVEQQRRLMTVAGSLPYAASVVDGPYVSAVPTDPSIVLTIIISVFLGGLVSFLIIYLRFSQKLRKL